LLTVASFPLALIFGIIGAVRDKDKGLATASALLAGAGIVFFFLETFCRH